MFFFIFKSNFFSLNFLLFFVVVVNSENDEICIWCLIKRTLEPSPFSNKFSKPIFGEQTLKNTNSNSFFKL